MNNVESVDQATANVALDAYRLAPHPWDAFGPPPAPGPLYTAGDVIPPEIATAIDEYLRLSREAAGAWDQQEEAEQEAKDFERTARELDDKAYPFYELLVAFAPAWTRDLDDNHDPRETSA